MSIVKGKVWVECNSKSRQG